MKVSTKFNVDTTIRCLVIVIAALRYLRMCRELRDELLLTLRDLMTLTFDLLTLVSGHTWRVTCSIHPPTLKILPAIRSWVMSSDISHIGYHWQCICSHCACAVSRDLRVAGKFFPHMWNPWTRFAYSLHSFYGDTIKINGVIRQNSL